MNKEELAREIIADCGNVDRKAGYIIDTIARKAKKRKLKEYHAAVPYYSPRRNNWTIFLSYRKRKEPVVQTIVSYRNDREYRAVWVNPYDRRLVFHTCHFFERYNQRFLQSNNTSKSALMKEFFSRNPLVIGKTIVDENSTDIKLFAKSNDGMGLGYREAVKEFTLEYMKTFITNEMIHSGQEFYASITSEIFDAIMKGDSQIIN